MEVGAIRTSEENNNNFLTQIPSNPNTIL